MVILCSILKSNKLENISILIWNQNIKSFYLKLKYLFLQFYSNTSGHQPSFRAFFSIEL